MAGICRTDLEIQRGYSGFSGVLGHEFVGEIAACTDPNWVSRRVVGEINIACGHCSLCRAGLRNHCRERRVLGIRGRDGAFADYLAIPVVNLHTVPEGMADEVATFTEPLAAACQVLEQVHLHPGDRVATVGDGKLGMLVAQVLALSEAELFAIGRHPQRLRFLARRGIHIILEETAGLPGKNGHDDWRDLHRQFDLVVECSGNPSGMALARRLVRPRGTIVMKSTYVGQPEIDWSGLVVDEITLVGSRCGPFPAALHLLAAGLVEVKPLIAAVLKLDDGTSAMAIAEQHGSGKVLLRISEEDTAEETKKMGKEGECPLEG